MRLSWGPLSIGTARPLNQMMHFHLVRLGILEKADLVRSLADPIPHSALVP